MRTHALLYLTLHVEYSVNESRPTIPSKQQNGSPDFQVMYGSNFTKSIYLNLLSFQAAKRSIILGLSV